MDLSVFVKAYNRGLSGKWPNPWKYYTVWPYRRGWRRGRENYKHLKEMGD